MISFRSIWAQVTRPLLWVVAFFSRRRTPFVPITSEDRSLVAGELSAFQDDSSPEVTFSEEQIEVLDLPPDFFLPTKEILVMATTHRPNNKIERANQKAALGIVWKKRVRCSICKELATRETAHKVDGEYVGDESCFDERLKTVE